MAPALPVRSPRTDFTALARAAHDAPSPETLTALWSAVFALPSWFFIAGRTSKALAGSKATGQAPGGPAGLAPAAGTAPQARSEAPSSMTSKQAAENSASRIASELAAQLAPELASELAPQVVERHGRRCVQVFTDELGAILRQTSGRTVGEGGAGDVATLEVGVDAAMALLERLRQGGVEEVVFNEGRMAFAAPVEEPERLRASLRRGERLPTETPTTFPSAPDAQKALLLERALAGADADEQGRATAIGALLALDDWWFICNPRQPEAVYVRRLQRAAAEGSTGPAAAAARPAVLAFSDDQLALFAADSFGLAADAGAVLLLQMPVEDAIGWLDALPKLGVDDIAFNCTTTPVVLPIADLQARWRERKEERGP